ncbi:MAG: NAD(+) synthase [Clostridia bacterium]|nr:NAD(+) synthase [Clostridia bacterium]
MKYGFVKTACASPELRVADTEFNANNIIGAIDAAVAKHAELIVFPELSVTGATCGDLFYSETLIKGALTAVKKITDSTANKSALVFIGAPIKKGNQIYNVAIAINAGKVLAVIPKTVMRAYNGYSDTRYFAECPYENQTIELFGQKIPFGNKIIFENRSNAQFTVSAEIGSDLFSPLSPSTYHALNGANIIVNLSSVCASVGKTEYIRETVKAHSGKIVCGYVYAESGDGESTTDCVYGGQKVIAENGTVLIDSGDFNGNLTVSEIDASFIESERIKIFNGELRDDGYERVQFTAEGNGALTRVYEKTPFVPMDGGNLTERAEKILNMQAEGLKKRISHSHASSAVLGLSGGLDSTLAILVAVTAMKKLGRPLKDVVAVTMPCFGTTSRTFQNTIKLAKALGVTLKKIDITKSVIRHLKDLKHPENLYDVTYENAQARERTQVLMDMANMNNGLVVGTGDLSELALGWATYNGDHMSMYGVNCSVPKTLVRHIVEVYAKKSKGKLKAVLSDILDTPVSPELLPAENDAISQKTEDIVGPYILHDFYLYNMIRKGFSPAKIYYIACETFNGDFKKETILKWLKTFVRRFFNQQLKRSCVPDGVKVGTVTLSPRGDWKMPSDAVSSLWLNELENL